MKQREKRNMNSKNLTRQEKGNQAEKNFKKYKLAARLGNSQ